MKKLLLIVFVCLAINTFGQNPYVFVFLNKKADAEKLSDADSKKIMEGHLKVEEACSL
jgi:hypothetical protein